MVNILYILIAGFVILLGSVTGAQAQTLTQVQALTFGDGIVVDNSTQHEIVLSSDGSFTHDAEFIFGNIQPEGIYPLVAAPQSAPMTVTIRLDQNIDGPGQDFFLDNFDIDAPATTDVAGGATIRVGARMRTSGNGIPYNPSTSFTGSFTVEVNF